MKCGSDGHRGKHFKDISNVGLRLLFQNFTAAIGAVFSQRFLWVI